MTRPRDSLQPTVRGPGGFTLVELLVTVTIIAILASLTFGAWASARNSARIQSTRNTIEKINAIIMDRYEAFHTRRLPVTTVDLKKIATDRLSWTESPTSPFTRKLAAEARLQALRALMLVEMPDRWSDVDSNFDLHILPSGYVSALQSRYRSKYNPVRTTWAGADTAKLQLLANNASAECLYMIVMSDPEAAAQFHNDESGDVDGDGLPEFHDAWGRPISFIRWPAGFVAKIGGTDYYGDGDLQVADAEAHHDSFDTMKTDANAYAIYPLIYSAGPDGKYDINEGNYVSGPSVEKFHFSTATDAFLDPYTNAPAASSDFLGQPMHLEDNLTGTGATGDRRHYDNIHNHRIEGR